MDTEIHEEIERCVKLQMASTFEADVGKHREHLDKLLGHLKWAFMALVVAFSGLVLFFGFRTEAEAKATILALVSEHVVDAEARAQTTNMVAKAISSQIVSGETVHNIRLGVSNQVRLALEGQAGQRFEEAIRSKTSEIQELNPTSLLTLPVGAIAAFWWTCTPEPPAGWLLCDGSSISKDQFPRLYDHLLRLQSGDSNMPRGANVVLLPDLRGYFLRGLDPSGRADPDGGDRAIGHTQGFASALPTGKEPFTSEESGAHTHTHEVQVWTVDSGDVVGSLGEGGPRARAGMPRLRVPASADSRHGHVVEKGGDVETRPKNVAVNFIIKY